MKIYFLKVMFYIFFILLFISTLFFGVIFFKGDYFFINSVKSKNYFMVKIFLKINPKLIETGIDQENLNAFDFSIRQNDLKLLMLLEPYTKKFNRRNANRERSIEYGLMWHSSDAVEYLLKNNLIRLKADFEGSYQDYLTSLLSRASRYGDVSENPRYRCAKLLILMGADPFFRHQYFTLRNSLIVEHPDYLIDAFEKDGIIACIKMESFVKEIVKDYLDQYTQENECFRLDVINCTVKVLNILEKKELKEADAEVIAKFKRYIIEELMTMKNKKGELLVRPPYRSPFE